MYYVLSAFFFFGFCFIWAQPNIPASSILPISSSEEIRTSWGNEEPKKLWSLNIGSGFSSVVDIGEKSFCQGYKEGKNTLFFALNQQLEKYCGLMNILVLLPPKIFVEEVAALLRFMKMSSIFQVMKEIFMH